MKVGIISDTHGWIHPSLFDYFMEVDEIWHAGDIGNMETAGIIAAFRPLKAVYGNIDDAAIRKTYPEDLKFYAEEIKVLMTHIGGHPGHYDRKAKQLIDADPPDIFVCGHSHIARMMHDRKSGLLYINPGAAGYNGFHKFMTAIRLQIDGKRIHDLELIEMGERGRVIL